MAGSSGSWRRVAEARTGVTLATSAALDPAAGAAPSPRRQELAAATKMTASPAMANGECRMPNKCLASGMCLEVEPEHELDLARRAGSVTPVQRTGDAAEGRRRG